ncbi:MAG: hypothetical protein M3Y34_09800, partial [Actinomycetota bacterium]|nr:hypothetical protein [Actinomycetota bacterium]
PERVGPTAHLGCPALALGSSAPLAMRLLSVPVLGAILTRVERPSPAQVERISRLVNQHPLSPEIAGAILATELMPGFQRTFHWNLNALLRLRGANPRYALTATQLRQVTQRSLLVFSRNDPMGAGFLGRRMAEALPGSELHLCDGGHCPWLDEPERIAGWIGEFFDRGMAGS